MGRNGKIKLDRLKKENIVDSPSHKKGKLTIIELDRQSPDKTEHRNKTKISATMQMHRQHLPDDKKSQI